MDFLPWELLLIAAVLIEKVATEITKQVDITATDKNWWHSLPMGRNCFCSSLIGRFRYCLICLKHTNRYNYTSKFLAFLIDVKPN